MNKSHKEKDDVPFTDDQIEWLKKNLTISVAVTSWGTVDVSLLLGGESFTSGQDDISFPSSNSSEY